ncbi:MAG: hypothetical protein IJJ94_07605 [Bacteroidaceae bacterium]|nr:hypothetical protein [Bacteroidaceae bacterium]
MTENKTKKAGVAALIFSFLIPLLGVVFYFNNKQKVENASAYLWAALGGFVLGVIVNLIMPA